MGIPWDAWIATAKQVRRRILQGAQGTNKALFGPGWSFVPKPSEQDIKSCKMQLMALYFDAHVMPNTFVQGLFQLEKHDWQDAA